MTKIGILILVIILGPLLLLSGLVGYRFGQNQASQPLDEGRDSPVTRPASPVPSPMPKRQTPTPPTAPTASSATPPAFNGQLSQSFNGDGFTLRHPAGWSTKMSQKQSNSTQQNQVLIIDPIAKAAGAEGDRPTTGAQIRIEVISTSQTIEQFYNEQRKSRGSAGEKFSAAAKTAFGGKDGLQYTTTNGQKITSNAVVKDGKLYLVSLEIGNYPGYDTDQVRSYEQTFNHLLATFEFK